MDIVLTIHKSKLPLDEFVADLMSKRVRQGYPEETYILYNGEPIRAYDWTDGVHSYQSTFTVVDGGIQEISIE